MDYIGKYLYTVLHELFEMLHKLDLSVLANLK